MAKRTNLIFNLILLVFTVAFFYSCPLAQAPAEEDAMAAMKADILAIWNDQNYDVLAKIHSEDIIVHSSSYAEPIVGIEAFTKMVKANAITFPDFELQLGNIYFSGDMTFLFWKAVGTNDGPFANGSPPTGKTIKIWGMAADKVVDGKVVETWIVWNEVDMLRQLGMLGKHDMEKEMMDEEMMEEETE